MDESTAEEWAAMLAVDDEDLGALPDRLLAQLRLLDNEHGGFAVDRLTHSLQTAHRAEADGRDDTYLVCALLHDVGDVLGPLNHADIAAAILKPWVSEAYHFMVLEHGIFQGYYFWHYVGGTETPATSSGGTSTTTSPRSSCAVTTCRPSIRIRRAPLEHYEPLLRSFFSRP